MVARLPDTMVATEGEHIRRVTREVVEEVESGDRVIGGQPSSTEAVRALAAPEPALVR